MDEEHRRKLKFRAWRRGFREMDLLMGSFADAEIDTMSEGDLAEFERLLATPDWEVFAWVTGKAEVPDNYQSPVLDRLLAFRYSAQPG